MIYLKVKIVYYNRLFFEFGIRFLIYIYFLFGLIFYFIGSMKFCLFIVELCKDMIIIF